MNQYTDFFTAYREAIDENCNAGINAYRDKAFETFRRSGFPEYGSENYRHVNITELLNPDFGFYLQPSDAGFNPGHVFHCDVPNLDSYKYFAVNGHFFKDNAETRLPGGVFSGDLNEFAALRPDVFSKYYNMQASSKGNGLTAFNTAFLQGGFVLYVQENTVVDRIIQLTNIAGGAAVSLVNRRMLVILERGAVAKLLVCDHAYDEKPLSAATQVTEIFAEENSQFDFCEIEESSRNTVRLSESFVHQAAGSELRINNVTLSNGTTRNDTTVDLDGENASIHLCGMAIADRQQTIDNHTLINHYTSGCRTEELFKYVLDDDATGVFGGRIVVCKDAQKTAAYQSNRNLLGSSRCRMYSKPQLEIYADDVKCSHGMTTGQLDETALFYMQSRGIPHHEAVMILKSVFMTDIIRSIPIEGLGDRLRMLVEKRFRGELATCRGCRC
jgi:Fe-S cluster assembly protein SufD